MLEKIDNIILPFQNKHPKIFMATAYIAVLLFIALSIPLLLLYLIFHVLHSTFYTGTISKKVNNKPDRIWI